MTSFKPFFVCALMTVGLAGCAHHELDTPVQSGDSTLFTSDIGPIDHESNTNSDYAPKAASSSSSVPPNRANQHSSIKTPKSAEYGSPTGTASGSGSNP